MSTTEKKSESLLVRLEESLYKKVSTEAIKDGRTMSDMARRILKAYYAGKK